MIGDGEWKWIKLVKVGMKMDKKDENWLKLTKIDKNG